MKKVCARATFLILTVSLICCGWPAQAADDIEEGAPGLPKVETDFSVIDPVRDLVLDDGESFATMIPPKSIKRIILLRDHGFGANKQFRSDADRLFAQLVKSEVRSKPWGLDALERTVAECLVVTEKGDLFKVTVLGQLSNTKGVVTGILLYGKGLSRRFDFRASPLESGTND